MSIRTPFSLISVLAVAWVMFFHPVQRPAFSQRPTRIEHQANTMEFDKRLGDNVRRLKGNVIFTHDESVMQCDSAYLYSDTNSLKAFSNVRIQINDTINIYGDILDYRGNEKTATLTGNVKMVDPQMTLTTSRLVYDLNNNTARYTTGGVIVDRENELRSVFGLYNADSKEFFFRDQVVLVNPQYIMHSDTLKYNTLSEIAYFFGPTTIESEENTIYCRNGWYDTKNDLARFSRDAFFTNKEQSLTGDSLFYDRNRGYGRADRNVVLRDSVQNTKITGQLAEHFEEFNRSVVTRNALLTVIADNDSLMLHADTLMSVLDESDVRRVFAYNRARFFRTNIQGVSDSIVYNVSDSTIYLYHRPVIWSDNHQLSANRIEVLAGRETVHKIYLYEAAFIASEHMGLGFDQVRGRDIIGHFTENELRKIEVLGNGETLYFVKEEDGSLVGINKAIAADVVIYIEDRLVSGIVFLVRPEAQMFPPDELSDEQKLLQHFRWFGDIRPASPEDIYIWKPY